MKNPKNILITGASSGIGEALALLYAAPDIRLYMNGRNEERLNAVAERCRIQGAQVETSLVNVTHKAQMQLWISQIIQIHPLDLIIANAGISGGTSGQKGGEPISQARQIFDVNLNGVLNTIEPALDDMLNRQSGQIAIVSSLAGYRGWPGAPAYSASKGAVRFYGEGLRGALKGTGVKVNVICPGFVASRITDANDFKMPFKMSAHDAAIIIQKGLIKDKGRIAFPIPTLFVSWFLSILPDALAQKILTALPAKGAIVLEDIPK
ncbi:MAG: SDR family NAD(P)-dependent oxidoreductase [Alphaproteobacteria bacterium]|nr:SDR family NAD(P)-dependent oxidoreductase [Alphaproteobacteria bacterium]NCQ88511.1 SDR family NAD(P)-dependent oxidoreductase [Alphaproteobacteria bacterium]NCT06054.1 SDR family NAD(P)-dependent oxidoreductase [Alphaproteobacteria bacterium]